MKTLGICITIFGVLTLSISALFSMYFIALRMPYDTCTGTYAGRFCVYSHSMENYKGKGIFNPYSGVCDPFNCIIDNGTYVFAGCRVMTITYYPNGTVISKTEWQLCGDWIPKEESGLLVVDWKFGGN